MASNTRLRIPNREVNTEQDRYGGYQKAPSISYGGSDVSMEEGYRSTRRPRTNTISDYAYTGRTPNDYPTTAEYVKPSTGLYSKRDTNTVYNSYQEVRTAPKSTLKKAPREHADIMPSIKTTAYKDSQFDKHHYIEETQQVKKNVEEKSNIGSFLVVYMVAVVLLTLAILGVGLMVSSAQANMTSLESELTAKQIILANMEAELEALSDPDYVAGQASDLYGMEEIDSTTSVTLLPEISTGTTNTTTNWFDDFCDWLSNIGG